MQVAAPRLVVLDRDGTLIRHVHYLSDPDQVEVLPTVRDGLRALLTAGCRLFLHTNQSGVGRGYFSMEAALQCNAAMIGQLGLGEGVFEAVCVCPEAPDAPVEYRKPSPRFGAELLSVYGAKTQDMYYIGDNLSDLLTAYHIGCNGIGVGTGVHDLKKELAQHGLAGRFPVCTNFAHAVDVLLAGSGGAL
jgi:D-glycero-D-manno-heptose 1,7-bisphosphate phosphatase